MADLRYPEKLSRAGTMEGYVCFEIYERHNRNSSSPEKTIWLYMPERLENPNTVEWDSTAKLGQVGGNIEAAGRAAYSSGGVAGGIGGMVSGLARAAGGEIAARMYDKAAELAKMSKTQFDTEGVAGSIMGAIRNPYLTLLFKGVNLRTFEMQFKLYPHSKTETDNIYNIIKEFRKASLPDFTASNEMFLGYPMEFQISYKFEGKENKYLHKFKRAALVGINTNYTASGMWSMTRDGFPAEIELNLRFTEVEIVVRKDVDDRY